MYRSFVRHFSLSNSLQKSVKTPVPVFGIEGRYVAALYSAASQMNQLDEVATCLKSIQKELVKPKIKDFIETSLISRAGKSKLLKDIATSAGFPQAAVNFLGLVAENGRLKSLRKIITMFNNIMMVHKNEALCEVITAEPLDNDTRTALIEILKKFVKKGQNINLIESHDPEVLGGFAVVIEDKHIDLCISTKIAKYSDILKHTFAI